jgi:hypothetical protein
LAFETIGGTSGWLVSVGNSDSSWALTLGRRISRPALWRQHRIKEVFYLCKLLLKIERGEFPDEARRASFGVDGRRRGHRGWSATHRQSRCTVQKRLRRRARNEREAEMQRMLRLLPH